jgi:hypothetical protein
VSKIDEYRSRHEARARLQKDKQATQGFGKKTYLHPDKITRFTWWVSIFTGCLFATSLIQALAFIQSERSSIYLSIEQIDPYPIPEDKPFSVVISAINAGRAQAFIAEAKAKVWVGKSLPENPNYADVEFSTRGAVPAQGRRYLQIGPLQPTLNWAQIGDIERGALKLYVFGYARYTDDFSVFGDRTIGFCGVYNPSRQRSATSLPMDECDSSKYVYSQ